MKGKRTEYHKLALVVALGLVTAVCPCLGAEVHSLQLHRPELFVDDFLIQDSKGLEYTIHPCEKLDQPVIVADRPWEKGRVYLYGTVLREKESGRFQMWYSGGGLAYAESVDGVTWKKPELSFHEFKGQATNLLLKGSNLNCVIHDLEAEDRAYRFKLIDNLGTRGFAGWHSADGLVWQPYEENPLMDFGSELINAIHDPATGRYLAFVRPYLPKHHPASVNQKRLIALSRSEDFQHWTKPEIIIRPDEMDDAWVKGADQRTEFYSMAGFPYGSGYLGLLPVFRITGIHNENEPGQSRYEGPIEVELVHSRDGNNWSRARSRKAVIPRGPHGYDAGCIMNVANFPIVVGDETWCYYTGLTTTHGGKLPEKQPSICLAKWRRDGFVSRDAGKSGGELTTIPLRIPRGRLFLNADVSDGEVVVAILDVDGKPLEGYDLGSCVPVQGDSTSHELKWSGGQLPADEIVRLQIRAVNAEIYSLRVE